MSAAGEESTGRVAARVGAPAPARAEAARKRAAVEVVARHEAALRQTARRYSLCAEDAEDAYQRALEILLRKAPTERPQELVRWVQTVTKHEALAIRRSRERLLGDAPPPVPGEAEERDWVDLLAGDGDGPEEEAERREAVARSREALRALKPAELRALTLLAAGYSYAEIAAATGFSRSKVNRSLAEGRERFRMLVSRSEDGSRCREMARLLSAFCDGEAGAGEEATVREHLRACAGCRAAVRAYRAAPSAVAALAPALPVSRTLLERAQEALVGIQSRLPGTGGGAESSVGQVAAGGGMRGMGAAALAKLLAACAGTAGGAACVAAGVAPAPLDLAPRGEKPASIERVAPAAVEEPAPPPTVDYEPAPPPEPEPAEPREEEGGRPATVEPPPPPAEAGAVEYAPPPGPSPPPAGGAPAGAPSGSPAGEFGP